MASRPSHARRAAAHPGRRARLRRRHGVRLRIDGTETQARRPRANRVGRRALASGNRKQSTVKATTVRDGRGRTLRSGATRPGRVHDQTAAKTEGIEDLLGRHPTVQATVDAGHRGLAKAFPDQVQAPPRKPKRDAPAEEVAACQQARKQQPSQRTCVEHANAEHKQRRTPQRHVGRRDHDAEAHLAVAGLVPDRAARR